MFNFMIMDLTETRVINTTTIKVIKIYKYIEIIKIVQGNSVLMDIN